MLVVSLGEVLLDKLDGASIPGGAPANVACHVAALGEPVGLVSRVGTDEEGARLADWLEKRRVSLALLQTDRAYPTGVVLVHPGPRYEISEPAAWDLIEHSAADRDAVAGARAVIFGTLAQRQPVSRRTIRSLVTSARAAGVAALCDLNLRAPFYDEEIVLWSLRNCDVLKLNLEELLIVSAMLNAGGSRESLLDGLLREFSIPRGVLTLGAEGALLADEDGIRHQPAAPTSSFADAVGAGDAFTATIAVALVRGVSLQRAGIAASVLAAHVLSSVGGTPDIPAALVGRVEDLLSA